MAPCCGHFEMDARIVIFLAKLLSILQAIAKTGS